MRVPTQVGQQRLRYWRASFMDWVFIRNFDTFGYNLLEGYLFCFFPVLFFFDSWFLALLCSFASFLFCFLLLCFSASLLLCFSAFLILCFSVFLLLCFSASLLFCFSVFCFSAFAFLLSASLLFCFSAFAFFCFSAFLLFPASLLVCFSVSTSMSTSTSISTSISISIPMPIPIPIAYIYLSKRFALSSRWYSNPKPPLNQARIYSTPEILNQHDDNIQWNYCALLCLNLPSTCFQGVCRA